MNAGPCAGFLFRLGLRRRNGERMWKSKQERKKDASEGRREKESVLERRNTALAQLCGTFDMSFEPSLITWAKTNTWAEKSYVLFESSASSHPRPLPRLNRDCSWHTCSFCNCWNVKLSPTLMWNYNLHKQLSLVNTHKKRTCSHFSFSCFFGGCCFKRFFFCWRTKTFSVWIIHLRVT